MTEGLGSWVGRWARCWARQQALAGGAGRSRRACWALGRAGLAGARSAGEARGRQGTDARGRAADAGAQGR